MLSVHFVKPVTSKSYEMTKRNDNFNIGSLMPHNKCAVRL